MNKKIDKENIMLNRNLNALVSGQTNYKRMKQKSFAASVNRNTILECEKIGIPLNKFSELALNAMKEIAEEIGL
ncbi:MAG: hypothetical protein U9R32_04895 [Bacteroidota bacterium]|nr:hypothetical protein [Bacteroidota bacterium]